MWTEGIQIENEEVKVSLFVDDLIVYIRDPKYSAKENLQLINTSSEVAEYKINSQNPVGLLIYK